MSVTLKSVEVRLLAIESIKSTAELRSHWWASELRRLVSP